MQLSKLAIVATLGGLGLVKPQEIYSSTVTSVVIVLDIVPAVSISPVFKTSEVTLFSCAASLSECPLDSPTVVTAITAVSTTVCPLTLSSTHTGFITTTVPSTTSGSSSPLSTTTSTVPTSDSSSAGTAASSNSTAASAVVLTPSSSSVLSSTPPAQYGSGTSSDSPNSASANASSLMTSNSTSASISTDSAAATSTNTSSSTVLFTVTSTHNATITITPMSSTVLSTSSLTIYCPSCPGSTSVITNIVPVTVVPASTGGTMAAPQTTSNATVVTPTHPSAPAIYTGSGTSTVLHLLTLLLGLVAAILML